MIGAAGDRRDDDIRELGSVAAQHFDVIVIREDDRPRGRKRGETAVLIAEGVRSAMAEERVAGRSRLSWTRSTRSTT